MVLTMGATLLHSAAQPLTPLKHGKTGDHYASSKQAKGHLQEQRNNDADYGTRCGCAMVTFGWRVQFVVQGLKE